MKLSFIILFPYIVLFLSFDTYAVSPDTLWTRTFGGTNIDVAHSVKQTSDSGYIIAGYTRSFGTMAGRNVWLLKTDVNGIEEWSNAYGGSADDEGYSVQQTTDGGYIVTGYTKSITAGGMDVFLVRTDPSGNQLWFRNFGGVNDDEGYSVLQTADGGFLIAGATSSFSNGGRDVWLIKTNSSGNEEWRKNHGGLSTDGARCIQHTSDGGYILTGWTSSYGTSGLFNAWLVKLDISGNIIWHKAIGGSGVDQGYCVQQTTDGGYILTGYTDTYGAGLYDMLLVKTDSLGNEQWLKALGGTGRDYGNSVIQLSDGSYIAAGYTLSFGAGGDDLWLVKVNQDGTEEWNKSFGGSSSDVGYSVIETFDGSVVIAGHTLSFGAGLHDAWMIKTTMIVPVEFVSFSGSVSDGNVVLNWMTASETNNRGFEIERHSGEGTWNILGFVEGSGTTTEVKTYTFTDNDVTAGSYQYRIRQIDFDGSYSYSEIIEIDVTSPVVFALKQNYPNPFNPSTKISWQSPVSGRHSLKVYDMLGNEAAVLLDEYRSAGTHEMIFNASHLSSGVYFYQLRAGAYSETRKMILIQ